jgi:hypothetical protein
MSLLSKWSLQLGQRDVVALVDERVDLLPLRLYPCRERVSITCFAARLPICRLRVLQRIAFAALSPNRWAARRRESRRKLLRPRVRENRERKAASHRLPVPMR